jgi:hypothetical protein
MRLLPIAFVIVTAFTGLAEADPQLTEGVTAAPAPGPYSVGVRVGGYGFRREGDSGLVEGALGSAWSECRMNGLGVFANRTLTGPLFLEAGLDTYFSMEQAMSTDLPIDRQSALASVAIGVRTSFTSWLAGYVQLGTGVELTRLAVPYGDDTIRANKIFPEGFAGVGADFRIGRRTVIGASLRTLVMANFDYDPARLQMPNQWVAAPSSSDVFAATPTLAAQGQFYLRREL